MRCHEVRQRLNELEFRGPGLTEDPKLQAHLAECPACAREAAAVGQISSILAAEGKQVDNQSTDLQQLRRRVEEQTRQHPRTFPETTIMSELKRRFTVRPRLSLGIAVAVLALAFVTLVPFKYDKTVGFEVAVAGVDKKLAFNGEKIQAMLGRLGVKDARVDVVGCDQTCNLTISELANKEDCEVVLAAFGSISGNKVRFDVKEQKEAAFGPLVEHAASKSATFTYELKDNNSNEAHNVFIERLGDGEEGELRFIDEFGDVITEFSGDISAEKAVIDHIVKMHGADEDGQLHETIFFSPQDGTAPNVDGLVDQLKNNTFFSDSDQKTATIELKKPASDDPVANAKFNHYLQQLKEQGYAVTSEVQDDGSTVYLLHLSESSEDLPFGNEDDAAAKETANLPEGFALTQNYPNPFNPTTNIDFSLPSAQSVRLDIYNIKGQLVRTLVDAEMGAGPHTVVWDATNQNGQQVASGIYLYRLTAGENSVSKKMNFVK